MTNRLLGTIALAALTVLVGASNAYASPVTWTLENVAFADGGTASGSFTYNATTNFYSAINISTTATDGLPATVFQYKSIFGTAPSVAVFVDSNSADLTGFHDLTFRFTSNLTDAGGTIPLQLSFGSFETTCNNAQCGSVGSPTSYITAGSVTTGVAATPEPATISLILVGLVAIIVARRRSAKQTYSSVA